MVKERNMNLDIIRAAALLFTISRHSVNNTGLYYLSISNARSFLSAVLALLFTSCVPLFLMLTGYLCNRKKLSKRYYLGYLRILEIYLICSVFCIAFDKFYRHKPDIGLRYVFGSIVNFYGCDYAWYLMLYTGLFLMIPFLNLMYHGLTSQKQKLALVCTFFALSALPSLLNLYINLYSLWWKNLYPICFYFTGAYLSEFKPQKKAGGCALLLLALLLAFTAFNTLYFKGEGMLFSSVYFDHFECYTITVLIFVTLLCIKAPAHGSLIGRTFAWVSELSLAAYLCSAISDGFIYHIFVRYVPVYYERLLYILPMALLSLAMSLIMAQVVHWLYIPISRCVNRIVERSVPAPKAQ